jgi:hypothetical protein
MINQIFKTNKYQLYLQKINIKWQHSQVHFQINY